MVLFALFFLLFLPSLAHAECTGASPTWTCTADHTSLDALINDSRPGVVRDGDTINVTQGGVVTWEAPLNITDRAFSLIGPGHDALTIVCTAQNGCLNWITKDKGGSLAGFTRLSGFTFTQKVGGCSYWDNGVSGSIQFKGTTGKLRLDHNRFEDRVCGTLHISGFVRGVIDHNIFRNVSCGPCHSIQIEHNTWNNSGSYGDVSWASDSTFGTDNQIVVEDNQIVNAFTTPDGMYATNDSVGARVTYRFNAWTNTSFQTHGTETNGRARGQRHTELYRNKLFWNLSPQWPSLIAHRGGTARDFDNVMTTASPGTVAPTGISFSTARRNPIADVFPWGLCGQFTITSITSSGTVATATHTGDPRQVHGFSSFVKISGANESKFNGVFQAQKATDSTFIFTVGAMGPTSATGTMRAVSPFDGNTDPSGYPCIDQLGRGKGILLSGTEPTGISGFNSPPSPNPPQWAGNAPEPMYIWNNTLGGVMTNGRPIPEPNDVMVPNRDFYNQVTPFTGTSGVGRGLRSARPKTCAVGVAYWATDGGGNWNTSTTETFSSKSGDDGALDLCTVTNQWTTDWYVPLVYPHPLVAGGGK